MSLKDWLKTIAFLLPLAAFGAPAASAQEGSCAGGSCGAVPYGGHCSWAICCPSYVHCTPKVPCLKYKCTCGKPLCDMCGNVPGYGYYPTCWRAYDQEVNYHCPVPTPTRLVQPPVPAIVLPPGDELPPMPRLNGDNMLRR